MHFDSVLFWNTLFDKGVLGAIVLALGYLINRRLERYRSARALETEAAKVRLAKIGELWGRLELWKVDAVEEFHDTADAILAELRAANHPAVPPRQRGEGTASSILLRLDQSIDLSPEARERVDSAHRERVRRLEKRARSLRRHIDRERFWLTDDLYHAMRRHGSTMYDAARKVELSSSRLAENQRVYDELTASRDDVVRTLQKLLGDTSQGGWLRRLQNFFRRTETDSIDNELGEVWSPVQRSLPGT